MGVCALSVASGRVVEECGQTAPACDYVLLTIPWWEKRGLSGPRGCWQCVPHEANSALWKRIISPETLQGRKELPELGGFISPESWCQCSCGLCSTPRGLCSEWAPVRGRRGRRILQPGFGGVLQPCYWQMDPAANQHEHGAELRRSVCCSTAHSGGHHPRGGLGEGMWVCWAWDPRATPSLCPWQMLIITTSFPYESACNIRILCSREFPTDLNCYWDPRVSQPFLFFCMPGS